MAATAGHFVVTRGLPPLARATVRRCKDPRSCGWATPTATACCARVAAVTLRVDGNGDLTALAGELAELPAVRFAATEREPLDE